MVPGRGRIGRQQGDVVLRIARLAHAIVHDRGQQDDAVQRHPPVFKLEGNGSGPQSAVGFAEDVFGTAPAIEFGGVAQDGTGKGVSVLIHTPEGRPRRGAQRPGIASPDHVNKDQIRLVQQGHVIRPKSKGGRSNHGRVVGLDPHGTEGPHMQPHRRRPRATIVEIGHRTTAGGLTIEGVGRVEQARGRHAVVVADRQRARRRLVAQGAPVSLDGVTGSDLGFDNGGPGPVRLDLTRRSVAQPVCRRADRGRTARILRHGRG